VILKANHSTKLNNKR